MSVNLERTGPVAQAGRSFPASNPRATLASDDDFPLSDDLWIGCRAIILNELKAPDGCGYCAHVAMLP
jgi:hypothetical protein